MANVSNHVLVLNLYFLPAIQVKAQRICGDLETSRNNRLQE